MEACRVHRTIRRFSPGLFFTVWERSTAGLPQLSYQNSRHWVQQFKVRRPTRAHWVSSKFPLCQKKQNTAPLPTCRNMTEASCQVLTMAPRHRSEDSSAWQSDQHFCCENSHLRTPYLSLKCCHPSAFPVPSEGCPTFLQICHPEALLVCISWESRFGLLKHKHKHS